MELVRPEVDVYLQRLAEVEDPVLREMERLARERGFPIVGPQVGRLLYVLAAATGARRVLELGSGFGYSALWFARAVGEGGQVVLTEGSSERAGEARDFLRRSGLLERAEIRVGDALEIAAGLAGSFDIVFNDIDKQDYPRVLEIARRRLRPGGLFISDNMLWRGSVLRPDPADATVQGVLELTRALWGAEDFAPALVPVRDGVAVAVFQPRD